MRLPLTIKPWRCLNLPPASQDRATIAFDRRMSASMPSTIPARFTNRAAIAETQPQLHPGLIIQRFLCAWGLTAGDSPKYSPWCRAHLYEVRDSGAGFIRGVDGCSVFRRPMRAPMSAPCSRSPRIVSDCQTVPST